ncbi:hypothetical protein COLO4_01012 [Corchorus olitorius]|uniref:Uncharacterized protein n=1 Tax=Corchorus olitorius TaxID=93759 RepID=A0A1R3L337_9ROSI|nr:hypothetical protein COLO4_01012 [Corchorus olitorius]
MTRARPESGAPMYAQCPAASCDFERHQEILTDAVAQVANPLQEVGQPGMQADRKDIFDAGVPQVGVQFTSAPLRLRRLTVAHGGKNADHLVHAGQQGTRHIAAQDQQLRHARRRNDVAIDLAIHLEAGHGTQRGRPVIEVALLGGRFIARRRRLELHVEQPGRVIRALQESPQPHELERVIRQHGADLHAARQVRAELHPFKELRWIVAQHAFGNQALHIQPRGVDGFPHLRGEGAANGSGVLARAAQAAHDRRRVGHVAHHEVDHVVARKQAVSVGKNPGEFGNIEHCPPALLRHFGRLRHQRGLVVHVEHAGGVLGAFGVARHPEKVVCGAAEHGVPFYVFDMRWID